MLNVRINHVTTTSGFTLLSIDRLPRDGTAEPSRETKLSGANGDRKIFIFRVQLRPRAAGFGNLLTRLIHALLIIM